MFIIVFYIFIYYLFRNKNKEIIDSVKNENNINNGFIVDNIRGIETIKNLNIEEKIIHKQNTQSLNYINSFGNYNKYYLKENSILSLVENIGLLLVLFKGYKYLNSNIIDIGKLTLVYSLFIIILTSIKGILNLDKMIISSNLSFERINSIFNYKIDNKNKKIIKSINSIEFNDIEINKKIYNISIKRGDNTFITGQSGIGKSSLFKSLINGINLKKGSIKINDISIDNIKENSIKSDICYVGQNEYVFSDTIKNNILMFKQVNSKDFNKVLKVTLLDKYLKKRNIKTDYLLEENGQNLSGGERQKILIARALLRGTNFIIFDETMNEIDIMSERKILQNINTEYDKTIILISHRDINSDIFSKKIILE